MKKHFSRCFFALLLVSGETGIAGNCTPPASTNLPVRLIPQEQANWCWAACAQMVMCYIGQTNVLQSIQAYDAFGYQGCWAGANAYDHVGLPQFGRYGFKSNKRCDRPLSWDEITKEIGCKGKPFIWEERHTCVCISHMRVVAGYTNVIDGGIEKKQLMVYDPSPEGLGDFALFDFGTYTNSFQCSQDDCEPGHWCTYYDVTPLMPGEALPASVPLQCFDGPRDACNRHFEMDTSVPEATEVARSALTNLQLIAKGGDWRVLGFEPGDNLDTISLGEGLAVLTVFRAALGEFRDSGPFQQLVPLNEIIVPVLSGNKVRSSITIVKRQNKWQVSSYGNSNLAKLLTRARDTSKARTDVRLSDYFAVLVPVGRNPYFVAYKSREGKLMFNAILEDPLNRIYTCETVAATDIFRSLANRVTKEVGAR